MGSDWLRIIGIKSIGIIRQNLLTIRRKLCCRRRREAISTSRPPSAEMLGRNDVEL